MSRFSDAKTDLMARCLTSPMNLLSRWPGRSSILTRCTAASANVNQWIEGSVAAQAQADGLRELADMVEFSGVPLREVLVSPALSTYTSDETELEDARRNARLIARFVHALGRQFNFEVDKVNNDWHWGVSVKLPGRGIQYRWTTSKEISCRQVEVTNLDGTPVLEEVETTRTVTETELRPKTETVCVTLFGKEGG